MDEVLKGIHMSRMMIVTFRVTKEERACILKLAQLLERSNSDAIRYVLRQVLRRLENDPKYLGLVKQF